MIRAGSADVGQSVQTALPVMSGTATLAALAARTVGRRVRLPGGHVGTVTRVTARGLTVSVPELTADRVTFLDD